MPADRRTMVVSCTIADELSGGVHDRYQVGVRTRTGETRQAAEEIDVLGDGSRSQTETTAEEVRQTSDEVARSTDSNDGLAALPVEVTDVRIDPE